MDQEKIIEEFRAALYDAGIGFSGEIIGDGKRHRYQVEGDSRGSENGWYVLHLDEFPTGVAASWKGVDKFTWRAKVSRKLSETEKRELEKKMSAQRRIQDAEEAKLHALGAERAAKVWAASVPPPADHAYIQRKGIRPVGIRFHESEISFGEAGSEDFQYIPARCLVVPIRDERGHLTSLQLITGSSEKRFLYGGRISGGYATIAKGTPTSKILICEGYATGASLHFATDLPVVVAFNAGNLEPVALVMRKKFPNSAIIICGDDDQWTKSGEPNKNNTGRKKATSAASAIGAGVVFPDFPFNGPQLTDFNDLAVNRGLPHVGELIEAAIALLQENTPKLVESKPDETAEPVTETEQPADIAPTEARGFNMGGPVVGWPTVKKNDKPSATIENVRHLMKHYGITASYNVISKDIDIQIPGEDYLVDTQRNDKMTRIMSLCSMNNIPPGKLEDFVVHSAGQTVKNPVVSWVTSKPWDGVQRLEAFYGTIRGNEDGDPMRKAFKETLMKRWMVSAIAVAFNPYATSTSGVLTIQGVQGGGKTHWFKKLTPKELDVSKDGIQLDLDNKDSVLEAVSYWLVELGEIDSTFKKSDLNKLKAFITKDRDKIRPPFARSFNMYNRRTVFFGSVNDEEFLADPTGSRRFWVIKADSVDYAHALDMQQVWAEFYDLFLKGEPWHLTRMEADMLNESNRDFEVTNPIEELVRALYQWDASPSLWRKLTASEIAIEIGIRQPKISDAKAAAKAVRGMNKKTPGKSNGNKIYEVPPLRFGGPPLSDFKPF